MNSNGPHEIFPGVFRIELPLPFELESVNVFLVRLDKGFLLIDCGMQMDAAFDVLENATRGLGIEWPAIHSILLTHMHPDHMGMAARLLELTGAELLMHQDEAAHLRSVTRAGTRVPWMDAAFESAGVPQELQARMDRHFQGIRRNFYEVSPDRAFRGGEEIETAIGPLRVCWTPGHSPGHVCLYSRVHRLLFSGDQILENITPNISWHPNRDMLGEYLGSLRGLVDLDVELIVPSHGLPFSGHRAWIAQTINHHHERCGEIRGLLANGSRTAFGLAGELWRKPLSPINHQFAVFEVLAHLEHMERQGTIRRSGENGALQWHVC